MSIKKSLRTYIILLASIPVIVMTVLAYILASGKYMELTKNSIQSTAETYKEGFIATLHTVIAENEILSGNMYLQSLLTEKINNPTADLTASAYYKFVQEQFNRRLGDASEDVTYSLYDVDGYFVLGTSKNTGDWNEYMDVPVMDIIGTVIYPDAAISDSDASIDIVSPVNVKGNTVGIVRTNVSISYFGSFLAEDGDCFVVDANGDFLFHHDDIREDSYVMKKISNLAKRKLQGTATADNSTIIESNGSTYIYGYSLIQGYDWIYIIRQDRNSYQTIVSSLPILLAVGLVIILLIALTISGYLTKKYTDPIMELNSCMLEAANGNYQVSCNIESKDEFGQLSHCFNEMIQMIADTNERQLTTQKQLEANEVQLIEHNKHVEELALTDGLTKLYNRTAFIKLSQEIINESQSSLNKHAVFFVDLDDFKNVNDTLGHDYGDELLIQVSKQLSECIENGDILARTGGDEFLIFKNQTTSEEDVENTANKLMDIAKHPFQIMDEVIYVSLSVGVSLFPQNALSLTELIKTADIAMYSAKNSGKNSYRIFNSSMEDEVNRKNEIIAILQEALANEEIYLVYQPQADVVTGKIIGYEALMRLNSSIAGYIPPSDFIPIAEECGIIDELGDWALFEACSFNKRLMNEGFEPIVVSVNVSTAQLGGNHLITTLERVAEETGMPLKYLEIEITESILMNDLDHNLDLIHQIKNMGAKIALDDFGTGYSSFNYLTQIPINTLKIDKAFIDGICNNEKDRYIADTIISLAHKMDIRVIAEGVEDINQLHILQEQMCDVIQGYYFSRPIEEDDFIELMQKN